MSIRKADRIMNRLDQMIEHAINGEEIETTFDETKMSALESKLAKYLKMNHTGKRELEEEKKRINELISDISHQTKTPIANMMLYSQLLVEQSEAENSNLTKAQRGCISALVEQAQKLDFLIASLMKSSRLEAGIVTVVPKVQPIKLLMDRVLEQILPVAEQKNITITFEQSDTNPIQAAYDLKWTAEAVFNILDNGVKYSEAGTDIQITVTAYQLFCRIDIEDHGIGIAETDIAKIFSRFYRAEAVREQEGVGLGLSLAREIITQEGGYIKVQSKVGEGSLFSVFLLMAE